MNDNAFNAMLRRIEQTERELERKYALLPVSKRIIELVDYYEGLERANASHGNVLVSDGRGGSTTLCSANGRYLAAIPLLLEKNEKLLNVEAAIAEVLTEIEEESCEAELERFESLLETANSLVELQVYQEPRLTGKDFGDVLLLFLEGITRQLHQHAFPSFSGDTTVTIGKKQPLILSHLCNDSQLQTFREFVVNPDHMTTTEEGILIWPCEVVEGKLKSQPGKRWATQQGLAWIADRLWGERSICGYDPSRFARIAQFFCYSNKTIDPVKLEKSANALRNDDARKVPDIIITLTGFE